MKSIKPFYSVIIMATLFCANGFAKDTYKGPNISIEMRSYDRPSAEVKKGQWKNYDTYRVEEKLEAERSLASDEEDELYKPVREPSSDQDKPKLKAKPMKKPSKSKKAPIKPMEWRFDRR